MKLGHGSRWQAWLLVALLHLALLGAIGLHRVPPLRDDAAARITAVRLIPRPTQTARPPPIEPLLPAPRLPEPALIPPPPLPVTPSDAQPPQSAALPMPAAGPALVETPPVRSTLRLSLPPGYAASSAEARNPALSDARSNTRRPSFEDKIADAAGATGDWVSERTSDHRTLLRRGDTCVEVLRSRIADMDRFNESVAPRAVSMVGKPYKCK